MGSFLARLFSSDFMPHGYCYLWRPEIVWLHAGSDSVIAISYYLIPLMLLYFVRQREDELESRVEQRAAELAGANAELRSQIAERQHAEEALQNAQTALAHVTRVTTMGELVASIAQEVNQPLAAIVTNGNACLRWLAIATPNLEEARAATERIIKESNRASCERPPVSFRAGSN
jgi:C4-dicarboxylate-specific signal transduction histidine kinase